MTRLMSMGYGELIEYAQKLEDLCQRNSDDLAFLDQVRAENVRLRAEWNLMNATVQDLRRKAEEKNDAIHE